MYPLLASAALSLAGSAIDALSSHHTTQAQAPAPADGASSSSFASDLAATEKARLQTVSKSICALPGVQTALASQAGQPVQLALSASGGLTVQAGNGPITQVKSDVNSAPLITEARQLLSALQQTSVTLQ